MLLQSKTSSASSASMLMAHMPFAPPCCASRTCRKSPRNLGHRAAAPTSAHSRRRRPSASPSKPRASRIGRCTSSAAALRFKRKGRCSNATRLAMSLVRWTKDSSSYARFKSSSAASASCSEYSGQVTWPSRPSITPRTGSVPKARHIARQTVLFNLARSTASSPALSLCNSAETASSTVGYSKTKVRGMGTSRISAWMCMIMSSATMESTPTSTNTMGSSLGWKRKGSSSLPAPWPSEAPKPRPSSTPCSAPLAEASSEGGTKPALSNAVCASLDRPTASKAQAMRYQAFGSWPSMAVAKVAALSAVRGSRNLSATAAKFL
mmetsp:Transcript_34638/g.99843  ORF Transcript_34638/g.99843 Transcript_34638/m.99843 type:complete len:322 (-) Transcript_34638:613-1578(-)